MMRVQFQIATAKEAPSSISLSPPLPAYRKREYPLVKSASASICEKSNNNNHEDCLRVQLLRDCHQPAEPLAGNANQVHQAGYSQLEFKRAHRLRPSTTIGVNLDSYTTTTTTTTSDYYDKREEFCATEKRFNHSSSRSSSYGSFKRTSSVRTSTSAVNSGNLISSGNNSPSLSKERCDESIYFKRDGQRFGHEFTLKLSVDCSYKCRLKIKPSISLRSISIQGSDISFYECTQSATSDDQQNESKTSQTNVAQYFQNAPLSTHNTDQLIYAFDWSASRFDANKNKDRTEVQMTLRFEDGQTLVLPLQVKFYHSDCRQHLNWGSLLHFIDYDCLINDKLRNISIRRVQFY